MDWQKCSGIKRSYLDLVAAQLNNRPRKTLKFKTPKEIIERGVALTD
ncbi:putative transposase [Shigella dysenteriae 155-74]|nr:MULTISPECIES: hypothetical protein [Shigella]EDX34392.1 IS30D transposase [Shigella dysenteriae 1012]EIQ26108.1 putative transposase [Shigella boydii 965-58]EGI93259.1 putative transposase [Shigella dysenteriae 155-74]EGI98945.1 putative transposase [Shigella dysenteriae 155-74]EGJ00297.1 putative transposase [Shigella dysenteriae 155-74]